MIVADADVRRSVAELARRGDEGLIVADRGLHKAALTGGIGADPRSASSEPISQSIAGIWVWTFASCPTVGSAPAGRAKVSAAIPSPDSVILLISFPL